MTRFRAFAPVLMLICGSLLITGCGGSGNDFKKDWPKQNDAIKVLGTDIATAIQGAPQKSDDAIASEFKDLAGQTKTIEDELNKLSPPSDVSSDFDSLKTALGKIETDLQNISDAGSSHDPAAAATATKALITDAPAVKSSRTAVDDAVNK